MNNLRRRTLISSGGGGTDPSQAAPLEVAFYNGKGIVIRKQEDWIDGETPIGIVVVPGYHNRYGDGSCGIISLVGMDFNHPESGMPVTSSTQIDGANINWGLNNLVGNSMFLCETALTRWSNYIPYQTNSASTACTTYTYTVIYDDWNVVWPYAGTLTAPTNEASTEYSNDGGYVTATSGKSGCDFNGIRNTAALYVKTRTDAQWTESTVDNDSTTSTPAAACAGRFKTVGTKSFLDVYSGITANNLNYGTSASTKDNKGFWYLPAAGELCYLPRYRFEINKTILALNQKYGNVGIQLNTKWLYISSSESSYDSAYIVGISGGVLEPAQKIGSDCRVRAFLRL